MNTAKDIKEVKGFLKEINNTRCRSPPKEKHILKWTAPELSAYIIKETKGMSISKKLKFAKDLDKRIKYEKKKARKKSTSS